MPSSNGTHLRLTSSQCGPWMRPQIHTHSVPTASLQSLSARCHRGDSTRLFRHKTRAQTLSAKNVTIYHEPLFLQGMMPQAMLGQYESPGAKQKKKVSTPKHLASPPNPNPALDFDGAG